MLIEDLQFVHTFSVVVFIRYVLLVRTAIILDNEDKIIIKTLKLNAHLLFRAELSFYKESRPKCVSTICIILPSELFT